MAIKAISTAALPLRQWPAPGGWTYQDYRDLPDDGYRYEVIWGELFMTPAPSTGHQLISRNLGFMIWDYVRTHDLGEVLFAPVDLVIEPGATPVQPDILFIAKEHLDIITEKNVYGVPDILIEILSPSNPEHDQERKFKLYEQAGVPEYWMVDPETHTMEIFTLSQGVYSLLGRCRAGEKTISSVLEGFSVAVDEVMP